jgi:hypothetical protein
MLEVFGGDRRAKMRAEEEKRKEFVEEFFEQGTHGRTSEQAKKAIAYCRSVIAEYEWWFEWNEARWVWYQRVVIYGGVIATLAGVATIPPEWFGLPQWPVGLGWLRGIPAAIVTVAAGLLSSFTYREDAVRQEVTAIALWNELAKYLGHAEPYSGADERVATGLFVANVCRLVESEMHGWRTLVIGNQNAGHGPSPCNPPNSGSASTTAAAPLPTI